MDPEIEELKELARAQSRIAEDTNSIVHKLHRGVWWGRIWTLLWWAAVLGIGGATYYYYLAPYVDQIQALYGNARGIFENFR